MSIFQFTIWQGCNNVRCFSLSSTATTYTRSTAGPSVHSFLYSRNTYHNHTSLCSLLAIPAHLYHSPTFAPRTSYESILCISAMHIRAELLLKYNTLLISRVVFDFYHLPWEYKPTSKLSLPIQFVYHTFSEENKINIR